METSLLFESFMVYYLLQVLFLAAFAWQISQESQAEAHKRAASNAAPAGPSASDLIRMRAKIKELERQK